METKERNESGKTVILGWAVGNTSEEASWRRGEDDAFSLGYNELKMPRNHASSSVQRQVSTQV